MDLMSLVPNDSPFEDDYFKGPRIVHNCEVTKEEDEIDAFIVGDRVIDKIKRWIVRKSVLSRNHPITRIYVKSTAAINYEISRHIRAFAYTIYPFSEIRSFWETLMTAFTIFALIVIPLILAFDFEPTKNSIYIILVIDFFFGIDILMSLHTGHYDNSTRIIILDRKIVASKYMKSFLFFDFLSTFPLEIFCIMNTGIESVKWYCPALNLTKIFRLRTIVHYSGKLRYLYRISFHKYKIYQMSTIIFLCIHWSTCLELYVAHVGREIDWNNKNRGSWIMSELMKDKDSKWKMYLACANRATVSLVSSSHFLDMKTPEDILLNLFLTVIGRIGFIYIIAQFFQLMTTFHSSSKRNMKFLGQLQEYMRYKELSSSLQHRLVEYFKYCSRNHFDREKHVVSQLSPHLREELLLHNYSRLVENVEYFRHLPQPVVAKILEFVKIEAHLPNEVIVQAGTVGDSLYFVASGTVAVYTSKGQEVCHLEDGATFGEVSLVMENEQRTSSILAAEICEIWTITRSHFLQCISPHPNLLNRLQKLAVDRLERNFRGRDYKFSRADVTKMRLHGRGRAMI